MVLSNDCWMNDFCKGALKKNCVEAEPFFCVKLFKLEYLFSKSLLSERQRKPINLYLDSDGADREQFNKLKDIQNNIVDFVKEGKNLYIHSSICGNGKTAWAIKLLQSYLYKIWPSSDLKCKVLFINVPQFLLALKQNISVKSDYITHITENVLTADLVVWDEVATKDVTTFEHENLLSIINARLDKGLSNIYTSNLDPMDIKERLGERLYSRIINLSTDIEFFGQDKRGLA